MNPLNVIDKKQAGQMVNDVFTKNYEKNLEAAKKHIESYISSSEEEDDVDEVEIINSIFKHYQKATDETSNDLHNTGRFLENILQSGSATCLICICSIKRADAIWSCQHCFCIFHLNCIKRWANDSIVQLKARISQHQNDRGYYNNMGVFIPQKNRSLKWCCPQCRVEYKPEQRPEKYECFCGKETNPVLQPWLVPHSCGEICAKELQPACGHKCVLLCHPGPCPPCAQFTSIACLCQKSKPKSLRCLNKQWQCAEKCTKLLSCNQHLCQQICHATGECPPCSSTSTQPCECGHEVKKRKCSELTWNCKKICNKKYECGVHNCKKVCHSGLCGNCPLGLPRSCPCGKTNKVGPCTEVIDTCGDTCQKLLSCGLHTCAQRCHRGDCNLCLVIMKKKCRCGLHEKELPCSKEYTCDTKCKQMRVCGKHSCSRKCCDGNCPPCDKICGKILSCKKHKCRSVCHDGPCYPCEQQSQINCRCGKTSKSVPCGRERTARVVCSEPCRIPSRCHHKVTHRCHKNECPPCNQKCGLPNDTQECGHICEAKCHNAVKVSARTMATMLPPTLGKQQFKPIYERLPHPACVQKVTVTCIGGHETAEWPCKNSKPTSCQRNCNRLLKCGNHKCALVCHAVPDVFNMNEQTGCSPCQEGCVVPRPDGCKHPCPRPCHPPPCGCCNITMRNTCHCGLTQVMFRCSEFYGDAESQIELFARRERLLSCGDRCQKNLPCGHRCREVCHSGKCPNSEACNKKVRVFCGCKSLKQDISCDKHRAGLTKLQCNEKCALIRAEAEKELNATAERLRQIEYEKNRLELEQFEKKFGGKRKPRERKINESEKSKQKINLKMLSIYLGILLAIVLAIIVAIYSEN